MNPLPRPPYWVDKDKIPLHVGDTVTVYNERGTRLIERGFTVLSMEIEFVLVGKGMNEIRKWPHNLGIEDSYLSLDEGL